MAKASVKVKRRKMTKRQMSEVKDLQEDLKHKPGVGNPFALARHIVKRKKYGTGKS